MLRKYGPFGAALLVFFVVFLLTENFVVPSFETCVSQNSSDQSAKESENKAGIVGRFVLAESICCRFRHRGVHRYSLVVHAGNAGRHQ
jgi:hypothetical protein